MRFGREERERCQEYAERLLKYQRGEGPNPGAPPEGYLETFCKLNGFAPVPDNHPAGYQTAAPQPHGIAQLQQPYPQYQQAYAPYQQAFPPMAMMPGAYMGGGSEVAMSGNAFGQVLAFTETMTNKCLQFSTQASSRGRDFRRARGGGRTPYGRGARGRDNGPSSLAGEPVRKDKGTRTYQGIDRIAPREDDRKARFRGRKRSEKKYERQARKQREATDPPEDAPEPEADTAEPYENAAVELQNVHIVSEDEDEHMADPPEEGDLSELEDDSGFNALIK